MAPRVLFVDDEEMNRTLLTSQLANLDFQVTACADGEAAFKVLATSTFDLIILDVMMPPPDGIEICRRIRVLGITAPILFLSGWPAVETQARALAAGGSAFLPRPYRREQLLATIQALLGLHAR